MPSGKIPEKYRGVLSDSHFSKTHLILGDPSLSSTSQELKIQAENRTCHRARTTGITQVLPVSINGELWIYKYTHKVKDQTARLSPCLLWNGHRHLIPTSFICSPPLKPPSSPHCAHFPSQPKEKTFRKPPSQKPQPCCKAVFHKLLPLCLRKCQLKQAQVPWAPQAAPPPSSSIPGWHIPTCTALPWLQGWQWGQGAQKLQFRLYKWCRDLFHLSLFNEVKKTKQGQLKYLVFCKSHGLFSGEEHLVLMQGNDVSAHREIPKQGRRKERLLIGTGVGLSWNKSMKVEEMWLSYPQWHLTVLDAHLLTEPCSCRNLSPTPLGLPMLFTQALWAHEVRDLQRKQEGLWGRNDPGCVWAHGATSLLTMGTAPTWTLASRGELQHGHLYTASDSMGKGHSQECRELHFH